MTYNIGNIVALGSNTSRALSTRFADIVNIRDFGAVQNGISDDTAAWTAAVALISGLTFGGIKLYMPAGRSNLAGNIAITVPAGVSLTIEGDGLSTSELYFTGATNGLSITLGTGSCLLISGVLITRAAAGTALANTGLTIAGPTATRAGIVILRDLVVGGRTKSWSNGIILSDLGASVLTDCVVYFPNGVGNTTDGNGLTLTGSNSSSYLTDTKLVNFLVQGGNYGVYMVGYVQGVTLTNPSLMGLNYGVYWNSPGDFGEQLNIIGGTINAYQGDIYSNGNTHILISSILLQKFNDYTTGWIGINLVNSSASTITGCSIYGISSANPETGIIVNGTTGVAGGAADPTNITGNHIANLNGTAVVLSTNTGLASVVGNAFKSVTLGVDNTANPTLNLIHGNLTNAAADISIQSGSLVIGETLSPSIDATYTLGASGKRFLSSFIATGNFTSLVTSGANTLSGPLCDGSYNTFTPVTGNNTTIGNGWRTVFLGSSTLATLTVTLPPSPSNKQVASITIHPIITSLTISPNSGQTIVGPAISGFTSVAGQRFEYIYVLSTTQWVRIG